MTSTPKPIRASMEIIWHMTCGECGYYWTYPTMNIKENPDSKSMHCPLCGTRSFIKTEDPPESQA